MLGQIKEQLIALACGVLILYSNSVFAKLPTIGTPITGTAGGWVGNMLYFFKSSAEVASLFVMLLLFLTVSYTLLVKFDEWRQGRAELAAVTVLAIVAAVTLIIAAILLGVATGVL